MQESLSCPRPGQCFCIQRSQGYGLYRQHTVTLSWLILTWVQSQWGTEGTGLELQQNPGHETAAEAPGDMQGGKASGGPGAPDSSFCYLESCLSHFQPGPVVIHH